MLAPPPFRTGLIHTCCQGQTGRLVVWRSDLTGQGGFWATFFTYNINWSARWQCSNCIIVLCCVKALVNYYYCHEDRYLILKANFYIWHGRRWYSQHDFVSIVIKHVLLPHKFSHLYLTIVISIHYKPRIEFSTCSGWRWLELGGIKTKYIIII